MVDERIIYFKDGAVYKHGLGSNQSDKLMDIECYKYSYCPDKDLVGCVKDSEGMNKDIYVYDLKTGDGTKVGADNATSRVSWSPNCSKFVYRNYSGHGGTVSLKMMRVV